MKQHRKGFKIAKSSLECSCGFLSKKYDMKSSEWNQDFITKVNVLPQSESKVAGIGGVEASSLPWHFSQP